MFVILVNCGELNSHRLQRDASNEVLNLWRTVLPCVLFFYNKHRFIFISYVTNLDISKISSVCAQRGDSWCLVYHLFGVCVCVCVFAHILQPCVCCVLTMENAILCLVCHEDRLHNMIMIHTLFYFATVCVCSVPRHLPGRVDCQWAHREDCPTLQHLSKADQSDLQTRTHWYPCAGQWWGETHGHLTCSISIIGVLLCDLGLLCGDLIRCKC